MPALSTTTIRRRQPLGQDFLSIFRATLDSATDEWIVTGFSDVKYALVQPIDNNSNTAVELNAQGTGATEGANPGDLGVRCNNNVECIIFAVGT